MKPRRLHSATILSIVTTSSWRGGGCSAGVIARMVFEALAPLGGALPQSETLDISYQLCFILVLLLTRRPRGGSPLNGDERS